MIDVSYLPHQTAADVSSGYLLVSTFLQNAFSVLDFLQLWKDALSSPGGSFALLFVRWNYAPFSSHTSAIPHSRGQSMYHYRRLGEMCYAMKSLTRVCVFLPPQTPKCLINTLFSRTRRHVENVHLRCDCVMLLISVSSSPQRCFCEFQYELEDFSKTVCPATDIHLFECS